MLYFLDTSALVKRYRQETGTQTLDEIFSQEDASIVICSLTVCEMIRTIDKHRQRKELSQENFEKLIKLFYHDLHSDRISIMQIGQERIFRANELIMNFHLSAADALILATALGLQDTYPVFVCADVRSGLLHAAEACHLSTLNPLSE